MWTHTLHYVSEEHETSPDYSDESGSGARSQKQVKTLYLCEDPDKPNAPVVLGSGSYAIVVLASSGAHPHDEVNFYAVKLLRDNTESPIYTKVGRLRFYSEIVQARNFLGDEPYVVGYCGYGQTSAPDRIDVNRKVETGLNNAYGTEIADARQRNEESRVHEYLESGLESKLVGEFYVMTAESGTLDDFLLQEFGWRYNALFRTAPRWRNQLEQLARKPQGKLDAARRLVREQGIELTEDDKSGLQILRRIDDVNPEFANRAIMRMFIRILDSIVSLHYRRTGDADSMGGADDLSQLHIAPGWAHRDIKPGNFLIEMIPPTTAFQVRATDLGYVIGTSDAGNKETLSATKDPGVLALGSYLYRAPEQVECRYQVLFEVPDGSPADDHALPTVTNRLSFLNVGDMDIHAGDLFESDNFFLADAKERNAGRCARTVIEEAEVKGGKWHVRLADKMKVRSKQTLYSADIIKLTGQHTDLFSLGAVLYLLASGGKNPEKFYVKCLEPIPKTVTPNEQTKGDVSPAENIDKSCFRLALALCMQPWEDAKREARKLYGDMLDDEDKRFLENYREADDEVVVIRKTWWGIIWERRSPDRDNLAGYLTAMRNNPTLRYYARNKNDKPIPFCILFEIVRLMVRDKAHSYVSKEARREIVNDKGEREYRYGYFAADLTETAMKCREYCRRALTKSDALAFDANQHEDLSRNADEMVFVLRLLFDELGEGKREPVATAAGSP